MRNLMAEAKAQYKEIIEKAVNAAIAAGELPEGEIPKFNIEIPADNKNGDLASNAAMVSAKAFRKAPRQIAEAIVSHMDLEGSYFEKAEVAGPGFLNFFCQGHIHIAQQQHQRHEKRQRLAQFQIHIFSSLSNKTNTSGI